jgi:hypothetical protein
MTNVFQRLIDEIDRKGRAEPSFDAFAGLAILPRQIEQPGGGDAVDCPRQRRYHPGIWKSCSGFAERQRSGDPRGAGFYG